MPQILNWVSTIRDSGAKVQGRHSSLSDKSYKSTVSRQLFVIATRRPVQRLLNAKHKSLLHHLSQISGPTFCILWTQRANLLKISLAWTRFCGQSGTSKFVLELSAVRKCYIMIEEDWRIIGWSQSSCFLYISIWSMSMTKPDKSKSLCQVYSITYEILYGSDNSFISLICIQSYANLEIHDLIMFVFYTICHR